METQKKQNGLAIAAFVLGIVGLLSSCILIGVIPAIIGFVLGIVALVKKQNLGMSITGIVCSAVAGMIFMFFMIIIIFSEDTETESISADSKETIIQEVEETKVNDVVSEKDGNESDKKKEEVKESSTNQKTQESEESFKAACVEYDYKEIARNPQTYMGKKVVLNVKINQILDGGLWSDTQYYRAYSNDEYGWWLGDEYIIFDERIDDDTKVLQGDILKIYGTIAGTTEVTRALTGVTEEIPAIDMKYMELLDEDTSDDVVEENLDVEILKEYTYSNGTGWYTYHFMVIRNNSNTTVDVSTSSLAYGADGTLVSVDDASFNALGAGCTSVVYEAFDTESVISYYDTELTVSKSKYYESVIQDLSYKQNDIEDGAIFQVTNNGSVAANFVQGYVLFFEGEKLVDYDSMYFTDDDCELKPRATISKQTTSYKDFDRVEFYLMGRR